MEVKKKINILMLSSSSKLGGGTKHMFMLGENLNNEFNVYYAIPKNHYFNNYLLGQNYIEIAERKIKLKDIFALRNFIKLNSIDIIHAHGKGAGAIGRLIRIFMNKSLIYTFHGIHYECHNFFIKKLYILYENILGRFDSYKVLVSKSEEKFAFSLNIKLGKNTKIINNGVFNKPIKNYIRNIKNKRNEKRKKISVISICRFVNQKNIFEMIKIALLMPEINFLIVGDGELRDKISNEILESKIKNVRLIGRKKNVFKYLYDADIYLSTSLYEGLPLSILEAMSVGLPIIASNVIGNSDTIEHKKSGYLYGLRNINEAVQYINKLANDQSLIISMGKEAFNRQRKFFSKEKMIIKYSCLYKNLIS